MTRSTALALRLVLVTSRRAASLFLSLLLALAIACSPASETPDGVDDSAVDRPLELAVSVAPVGWLIEQIAGPHARVHVLVPPGAGPETFLPTDASVGRVASSDLYFHLGLPFEQGSWMRSLEGLRDLEIVSLTGEATHSRPSLHGGGSGEHRHPEDPALDPHRWLDIDSLRAMAAEVATALARLRPLEAAIYAERRATLETRLVALDSLLRTDLESLRGTSFLVFHPAWARFAAAYELRQLAVEVDGRTPTDAHLADLAQQVQSEGLRVLFVAPEHDGADAAAVAERLGMARQTLDPLGPDPTVTLRQARDALLAAAADSKPAAGG